MGALSNATTCGILHGLLFSLNLVTREDLLSNIGFYISRCAMRSQALRLIKLITCFNSFNKSFRRIISNAYVPQN